MVLFQTQLSFEQNTMPMWSLNNAVKMAWWGTVVGWVSENAKGYPYVLIDPSGYFKWVPKWVLYKYERNIIF
jgi:hypothetical protein